MNRAHHSQTMSVPASRQHSLSRDSVEARGIEPTINIEAQPSRIRTRPLQLATSPAGPVQLKTKRPFRAQRRLYSHGVQAPVQFTSERNE